MLQTLRARDYPNLCFLLDVVEDDRRWCMLISINLGVPLIPYLPCCVQSKGGNSFVVWGWGTGHSKPPWFKGPRRYGVAYYQQDRAEGWGDNIVVCSWNHKPSVIYVSYNYKTFLECWYKQMQTHTNTPTVVLVHKISYKSARFTL